MLAELVRGTESAGDPIRCDTGAVAVFEEWWIVVFVDISVFVAVSKLDSIRLCMHCKG